ncbi:hypothetical protein A2115_03215 [Candidatus Woesebacteria bacterium GWA1_41_8]|jgi:hypothetical protein|uniref:Uncharacterized protein n=1 Tax=Candidatus Woesebacteria bacterium GWA1_41_8 TaxID=1802471 RepID=A0A1F7WHR6_9BACT|nr:MAG: hypothetical protein A2115_03215 [Candidatus Woesebacteria bacterium GWA1_41_8]
MTTENPFGSLLDYLDALGLFGEDRARFMGAMRAGSAVFHEVSGTPREGKIQQIVPPPPTSGETPHEDELG